MHPKQLELFKAIAIENNDDLKAFLNQEPQACWILNEDNLSAFDYALKMDRRTSINVMLEKLSYDANICIRSKESEFAFHYALVKAVKHFCAPLKKWDDYLAFYQAPEKTFSFLTETKKDWITWGRDLAFQQSSVYVAFSEMTITKPKIQRYVRANAIAIAMTLFFNQNGTKSFYNLLRSLSPALTEWCGQKIFSDHSTWGMSYLKETEAVTTLRTLKEACEYLITHAGEPPADCTLDMAQKIILLCVKAHPFSSKSIQEQWVRLVHGLIDKHQHNYDDVKVLYKSLMHKQWLSSGDNIPFVDHPLIKKMDPHDVALYLDGHELEDLGSLLDQNKVIHLKFDHTLELLNYFPMPQAQKHVLISQALDNPMKEFLHGLIMNNASVSVGYANTDLFRVNPIKLFAYAPNTFFLDVCDASQVAHISAYIEMQSHTQAQMGLAFPKALLDIQGAMPVLHTIQQALGPKQSVIIQILDDLDKRLVLADMIITKSGVALGPQMLSKNAAEPKAFFDLYQKFNWIPCLNTSPVDVQIETIRLARDQDRPLMFVFYQDYDVDLLVRIRGLLKEGANDQHCMIRFDCANSCDSDFVVNTRTISPGPLSMAKLCTNPNRVAEMSSSSTSSMVRTRAKAPKPVAEQPAVVQELPSQHDDSHDNDSNRPQVTN